MRRQRWSRPAGHQAIHAVVAGRDAIEHRAHRSVLVVAWQAVRLAPCDLHLEARIFRRFQRRAKGAVLVLAAQAIQRAIDQRALEVQGDQARHLGQQGLEDLGDVGVVACGCARARRRARCSRRRARCTCWACSTAWASSVWSGKPDSSSTMAARVISSSDSPKRSSPSTRTGSIRPADSTARSMASGTPDSLASSARVSVRSPTLLPGQGRQQLVIVTRLLGPRCARSAPGRSPRAAARAPAGGARGAASPYTATRPRRSGGGTSPRAW